MGKGNKKNFGRNKKRTNAHLLCRRQKRSSCADQQPQPPQQSLPQDELNESDHEIGDDTDDYFILMNYSILKAVFDEVAKCAICQQSLNITDNINARMGFAHCLTLTCTNCGEVQEFFSSLTCSSKSQHQKQGRLPYDVNIRTIIASREVGLGYGGIETFCKCLNIFCLANNAYQNLHQGPIKNAYQLAANKSMQKAVAEYQNNNDEDVPANQRVTMDGTWQRRGHASLHGIVTAMIDKKCVDYEVLSKFCFGCKFWQDKTDSPEYEEWRASHICEINHIGSSGAMESAGAISIFNRSVEKNNLIYAEYLGDGDTSSFKDVVDSEPYKEYNVIPVKLECIGHVQKRLGTRLRKLVKNHKGTSNPLHGRGKLTDTIINSMQNFYGLAIRNNLGNIYAMKKAVWAVLFHCTKFDDIEYRHQMCPRDADSWCKFHLDKLNNTNEYVEHVSLPVKIFEIVKPIFKDLSADPLLSKCLHGKTQNANEAINSIIWKRCPKNILLAEIQFKLVSIQLFLSSMMVPWV